MTRSPLSSALVFVVVFLCGVAVGAFIFSPAKAPDFGQDPGAKGDFSAGAATAFSDGDPQGAELRAHVAEVEKKLTELGEKQDAAILHDRLDFYKKYKVSPESFGPDLHVTNAMAEFLKMSGPERKAVNDHLAQIHDQIRSLAKQNLKLVKQTDDSVSYEIEPFPEGKALKDQLHEMVEGDLGAERGDLFMTSAQWEMDSAYFGFGEGKAGLQVTRIDQKGGPSYRIKETYANGGSMEQSGANALPAEFNGLVELDPNP